PPELQPQPQPQPQPLGATARGPGSASGQLASTPSAPSAPSATADPWVAALILRRERASRPVDRSYGDAGEAGGLDERGSRSLSVRSGSDAAGLSGGGDGGLASAGPRLSVRLRAGCLGFGSGPAGGPFSFGHRCAVSSSRVSKSRLRPSAMVGWVRIASRTC